MHQDAPIQWWSTMQVVGQLGFAWNMFTVAYLRMDRALLIQVLPIQWAATVLMSSPFFLQLLKLHLPFPHIGSNNCFKWQAEPSIMRMLARPPVAVTPVLHRGDSWKQALKLPSLTPFHVLSHQNHSIFKALRESVTNWKSNTFKLTSLWVTPHWNTR